HLIELVPRAGPAGPAYPLQVTIRGTGFSRTSNTVEFGPVRIAEIASQDGTQLSFQVPKLVTGRGEVPPAVLSAGEYRVTVTTAAGTSNALVFELTR
ncbi:MAG: IPT/TIG domain-containing protein, partial [Hyphomicrobiales bacterium]|nr:IPT/TIG domain-containing protein [Hyphomicrobiales bacterium]